MLLFYHFDPPLRNCTASMMDLFKLLPLLLLVCGAVCWKLFCAVLRERRRKLLASLHPIKDAHHLIIHTLFVDFPFLTVKSLEFGLLRTYAIPEISKVLKQGNQFTLHASKRYDDTQILVYELLHHHVDGDRGSLAVRRLNFLHAHYPIHNREYLYVLSIFMLLPSEWATQYGYREWTDQEKHAYFTIWRDIGTRMGITETFDSLDEASKFKEDYEMKQMVYSYNNRDVADATMKLFLGPVPWFLRPLGRRVALSLMDERLLRAFGYPRQPRWLERTSHGLLKFLAGTFVQWLFPPRPLAWVKSRIPIGCPKFQGGTFDPDAIYRLAFQVYKPETYKDGYRIPQVGSLKPGGLACKVLEGELTCPLEQCTNSKWPPASPRKDAKRWNS